ncbi:hypothetical protein OEE91_003015 [Citrobacter freundii]
MQTINNRMTETQIADLFSLAVQLQVKAEESEDRDTAILAYLIQNACSNLTESRREFWAADATINNLELRITDMAVQLANAESKCRELAAENAGLNVFIEEECFVYSSHTPEPIDANDCKPETPATDAFLAEVRASELDSLAGAAETMLVKFSNQQCSSDMHEVVGWKMVLQQATNRAAQLRKGAAL